MLIFGVDPGLATVGVGVIEARKGRYRALEYGAIKTKPRQLFEDRLSQIYDGISDIISRHKPDCMAVEELFFNTNAKTALDVAQARGVILLAARRQGIDVYEYTPLQVKLSVVGYGRAEKSQVIYMTKLMLNLKESPKPDDTADALAIAICHGNVIMHNYS
ncbi:MAG: crossover junction endodeoxyribonuclease RuvC [Eubacteriales bacterium]